MRKTNTIALNGIIAAIYVVMCMALSPISYGAVQVRLSDTLYQILPNNKRCAIGLIIGTAVSNIFSPLGIIDVVFGTIGTAAGVGLAVLFYGKIKKVWARRVFTAVCACIGMVFVAWELCILYHIDFIYTFLTICAGEAVAQAIGILLFSIIDRVIVHGVPNKKRGD